MANSHRKLLNLVPATHTPFDSNGVLNLAVVEQQAAHLLKNGIQIVFIGGSTGESHSLQAEERRRLAQRWAEVTRGTDLRFVVHVGSNSIADAQELAAHAESIGALAISALAPSYFKPPTLDALIACCADVAAKAPNTPFYFYDIPSLTGVNLSMPEFLERAPDRVPTLAGLKFTNSDLMSYQCCLRAGDGRFDVPYGTDEWLLAAVALGAKGAVGSTYNFAAPIYHRMLSAWKAGDLEAATSEQFRSVQLVRTLQARGFLAASKAVMRMLGIDVGAVRRPLVSLNDDDASALRTSLEKMGFFDWIR